MPPPLPASALPLPPLDADFLAELVAVRRDLHAHPELAFAETRTADIVAAALAREGIEVHRGLARTGVVGVIRAGSSPRMIGLRADMDALPVAEANTFAHRSQHPGRMHACGHDGHTAMLLGAARYLARHRDTLGFDGSVVCIFQPAEESEGGAAEMIADGLFAKFPVEAVFGLHNWPGIPVGEMAVMAGPVMAGTCAFEIVVRGRGCHAAMPHQGSDSIVAASQLVQALQTVVSRQLHPCEAAVVSVTQFNAGSALNIIPGEAVLRGTIRSFKPAVQATVEQAIERLCAGIAAANDLAIAARFDHRYPPTVNSTAAAAVCRRAAAAVFGEERVRDDELPSMGAEDFAYMLREKPGCYVWLGNGDGEVCADDSCGGCTLHNPRYDFNDAIIEDGVRYWVALVREWLAAASDS